MPSIRLPAGLKAEWLLAVSLVTSVVFLLAGQQLTQGLDSTPKLVLLLLALFLVIVGSAMSVVRHADKLAESLGEPYGTLILTLSITSIEVVSISAVMLHGANNPTLARDALFAVTMIILNGMVGLSLLLGGWRRREQSYNLQGANAYLGLIIPLGVLSLVLPNFTLSTAGPGLSSSQEPFVAILSIALYATFVALQTRRHRDYFNVEEASTEVSAEVSASAPPAAREKPIRHALLLVAYMIPVVYLAEKLAAPVDYLVEKEHAPAALAGLIMAVLVATPEVVGAARASSANHLQRSINISLGSVLSTIGLTIPAILLVGHLTHHPVMLGLQHTDLLLFLLTLVLSMVTFSSGRTNVMQGAVHLVLFAAYLFLMFQN